MATAATPTKIIEERLHARNSAKKARGEVFTPLDLVHEMLLGVRRGVAEREGRIEVWGIDNSGSYFDDDEDDRLGGIPMSVWRDPTSRLLDPAGGIGNFLVVAFKILDFQLGVHGGAKLRDEAVRRRHIVENMLFMFELDAENVKTAKAIFKTLAGEKVATNFHRKDTLGLDLDAIKKLCGTTNFTVIMGNPPFNSGGVKSSGTGAGYETLWPHFLLRTTRTFPGALSLVAAGGHLCMIHPSSWLHEDGVQKTLHDELLGGGWDIQSMRAYTNLQTNRLFNYSAAVPCTYYVVSNRTGKGRLAKFPYINVDGVVEELPTRPGTIFQRMNGLMAVIQEVPRLELESRGKLSVAAAAAAGTGKYEYVCQHLGAGVNICKSSVEPAGRGEPKIILKGTSKLYFLEDFEGKYGVYGNWGYWIKGDRTKLARVAKFLGTKFARAIMMATKEDQDFIEPKWLPDMAELKGVTMTDAALCKHFGIDCAVLNVVEKYENNQKIAKRSARCSRETCSARKLGGGEGRRRTRRLLQLQ